MQVSWRRRFKSKGNGSETGVCLTCSRKGDGISKAGQAEGQVKGDKIKIIKKLNKKYFLYLDYMLVPNCSECFHC